MNKLKYFWRFYLSPMLRSVSSNSEEGLKLRIEHLKTSSKDSKGGRCYHSYQQARSYAKNKYLYSFPFCELKNTWCDFCERTDKKQCDCPDFGATEWCDSVAKKLEMRDVYGD